MSISPTHPDTDLTDRQRAILDALVRRTPIKQIAYAQGIAPSTVNDHIKAIKRKFGVTSTADLVARSVDAIEPAGTPPNGGHTNRRVFDARLVGKELEPGRTDALAFSDSMAFSIDAPWAARREPRVVPEELDGPGATLARLVAIGKTVALILAMVVLSVMALETVDGLVASGTASAS